MSLFLSFSSLNPQSNIMTDKTKGACFLFYDKKKFCMKIFISKKENISFPGLWWVFLVCWYNYIVHTCIPLDQYSSRHVLFFLSPNIWVPLILHLTAYHQSEQPRLILYHRSLFVFSLSCDTQVLALLQLIDSTFQASDWHWQMPDLMIYLSVQTRKIGHSWQRRKHCFL